MHISEMRRREDFDAILAETLSRAWSQTLGKTVTVASADSGASGQQWVFLPVHSAFIIGNPSPQVRRFLADSVRYTSRRGRRRLGRRGARAAPAFGVVVTKARDRGERRGSTGQREGPRFFAASLFASSATAYVTST